jgi:hypothetical protein
MGMQKGGFPLAVAHQEQAEEPLFLLAYDNESHDPYNARLLLYHDEHHRLYPLLDAEAAPLHLECNDLDPEQACPPGLAWDQTSR